MRYQGRVTTWILDKGYGFITPNGGGPRVFVHRKDFEPARRPRVDELVTYELAIDEKKRHNAHSVQSVVVVRSRGMPAIGAIVTPTLAVMFFAFLLSAAAGGKLPWAAPAWYAVVSLVTFVVYRRDKAAATRGEWRTPEQTLHVLSLAGGWPGALIAQRWLRHKSTKTSFVVEFVVTVALNLAAVVWLQSGGGWEKLRSYFG